MSDRQDLSRIANRLALAETNHRFDCVCDDAERQRADAFLKTRRAAILAGLLKDTVVWARSEAGVYRFGGWLLVKYYGAIDQTMPWRLSHDTDVEGDWYISKRAATDAVRIMVSKGWVK